MSYVIPPADQAILKIRDSDSSFPVRRIYCVGRNYAAHAREMGKDPDREPPFFFCKPADAIVPGDCEIPYPSATSNFHYEVELVVAIGKPGHGIGEENALGHVYGYAVGLDMTRRDLQQNAKDMGRPWDTAKGFDNSAPCSELVSADDIGHPDHGRIWLDVNNQRRQEGDLRELIWSVPETIACLSGLFSLESGDLIFTGTPAGVGPVVSGDTIKCGVDGVAELVVKIGQGRLSA